MCIRDRCETVPVPNGTTAVVQTEALEDKVQAMKIVGGCFGAVLILVVLSLGLGRQR